MGLRKQMIYFNKSGAQGKELSYLQDAVASGRLSGDQTYSKKVQDLLESVLSVPKVLVSTSCTHALEMAALLLDVREGDEVIVPSFTFVSTANAFVLRGATPVFCDIRPDTLNLDETKLESLISPKTKAIVPVHYAGVGCEMDAIMGTAARHGIAVIEDNAHGLFGKYKGRWLGTLGTMATQSFHETKNITCGEGGALIVNDRSHEERAEIIREKGTNRARFFRGQTDKYSWVDVGSSYVMSELQASFLLGQLEQWSLIQGRRRSIWQKYDAALCAWADTNGIRRPVVPDHCEQAYHMYYLLMPSLDARTRFIDYLAARDIKAVFHYVPLHTSAFAQSNGLGAWSTRHKAECVVTKEVSERLVRLPFYTSMTESEQDTVIDAVLGFR